MPPVLGVVGAGQLARMTHQATIGLGVRLRVLADAPDDSAAQVCPDVVVASHRDLGALRAFAGGCDVVTFDHELVDPEHLAALEAEGALLRPGPAAKRFGQDKAHQRRSFAAAGLPVPAFAGDVAGLDDVVAFAHDHGWPVVAKATRGGYDGRGVWVLDGPDAARVCLAEAAGSPLLVEEHVALDRELAVLVARRPSGECTTWPLVETVQVDGMLASSLAPAPVVPALAAEADALARRVADHVGLVGLMAVELFLSAGALRINEVALRPHNSGHWTIEGARTSQFANHARAVLDWPLGATTMTAPFAGTVNVVGPRDGSDPRERVAQALGVGEVAVHLYGKAARPGRKLGHVTALGDDADEVQARAARAAAVLQGEAGR